MNKVTVKRIRKSVNDLFFQVEWEGDSKHFTFREDAPEGDIWNEELNRKAALEFAKKVESGTHKDEQEIIYQTPETNPDTLTSKTIEQ